MTIPRLRRSRRLALLLALTLVTPAMPAAGPGWSTPAGEGGVSPLSGATLAAVPVAPILGGAAGGGHDTGADGSSGGAPPAVAGSRERHAAIVGGRAAARAANLDFCGRAGHHASIRSAHLAAPPTAPPSSTL